MKYKRIIILTIIILTTLSLFVPGVEVSTTAATLPRTAHTRIRINNHSDFNKANGVTAGSGTKVDPFIIENYDIDAKGKGSAIYIGNTTLFL